MIIVIHFALNHLRYKLIFINLEISEFFSRELTFATVGDISREEIFANWSENSRKFLLAKITSLKCNVLTHTTLGAETFANRPK